MSTFNQGNPSVSQLISAANCIVYGNTSSGNALSVQQLGAGNVASFRTTTGATALFINPAGNVGINQTAPQTLLHVTATAANSAIFIDNSVTGGATPFNTVRPSASGAGSANCHIWSDGNAVGTSDSGFLRIAAGGGSSGTTKSYIDISGYSTVADMNQNIVFGTSGSEKMRITTGGNVGIGTASPVENLHVYSPNAGNPTSTGTGADSNAAVRVQMQSVGLDIGTTTAGATWFQNRVPGSALATGYPISLNPLGGNVGVGTTNPAYALDVLGLARVNTGTSNVIIGGGQGAGQGGLYILPTSSISGASWKIGCGLQGSYSNAISFDSGCNVGIGTTNPQTTLQVSGPANTATNRATPYANAFVSVINDIIYGTTSQVGLEIGSGTRASGDNDRVYKYVFNAINNATVGAGVDFQILAIPTAPASYASDGTARNRMTIRYDGNVGIGTTNPGATLDVMGSNTISTPTYVFLRNGGGGQNSTGSDLVATQIAIGNPSYGPWIRAVQGNGYYTDGLRLDFCTNITNNDTTPVPRLTILGQSGAAGSARIGIGTTSPGYPLEVSGEAYTSGTLYVGTTNTDPTLNRVNGLNLRSDGRIFSRSAGHSFGINSTSGTQIQFWTDNGSTRVATGAITSSGATTSYTSASDYRLKENVQPITGALNIISSLNPVTYTWKSDGSPGHGFIAHELQEVVPDAVVGEKDAVNSDGTIKPQNVDKTYIISYLTAAIQELSVENTALKTQMASLEQRLTALEARA